jgi:hypothetical protein
VQGLPLGPEHLVAGPVEGPSDVPACRRAGTPLGCRASRCVRRRRLRGTPLCQPPGWCGRALGRRGGGGR